MKKLWIKKRAVAAFFLSLALLMTACGSSKSNGSAPAASEEMAYESASSADYAPSYSSAPKGSANYAAGMDEAKREADVEEAAEAEVGSGSESDSSLRQAQDGEKIVYTANLSMQTLGYEESVRSIKEKIRGAGGFIESEYESDSNTYWYEEGSRGVRSLDLTVRIPSAKFESFLDSLEGDGKITGKSVNAQNISQVYNDTESTKKALEVERDRLLLMMDKAETIEDMIAVEARLSEVERELNTYRTSLSAMDRDVEYSTVYITLKEVRRYTQEVEEVTFITRLKEAGEDAIDGFIAFVQGLILFVVRYFPFLIILAVIILLVRKLIQRHNKKRAEKLAASIAAGTYPANGVSGYYGGKNRAFGGTPDAGYPQGRPKKPMFKKRGEQPAVPGQPSAVPGSQQPADPGQPSEVPSSQQPADPGVQQGVDSGVQPPAGQE